MKGITALNSTSHEAIQQIPSQLPTQINAPAQQEEITVGAGASGVFVVGVFVGIALTKYILK